MKDKILHITTDEKFVDSAMFLFEKAFPNRNLLRVIKEDKTVILKFIKNEYPNTRYYYKNEFDENQFIGDLNDVKYVIFHNIDYFKSNIILNFVKPVDVTYLWIFWGGEVFNNLYFNSGKYISEETKNLVGRDHFIIDKLKSIKRSLFKYFHPHYKLLKAIKEVDVFLGLKSDYDLLLNSGVIDEKIKYINFSYYPMDYIVDNSSIENVDPDVRKVIFIGNSATLTNNHIDVIKKLAKFNSDFTTIFPMNYGDTNYRDIINSSGKKILGEKFNFLIDYLALDEYNNILKKCDIAIMNHYRQQAVGNILTLLYFGKKVVLNEKSSLYKYLTDLGFKVLSFSKFTENELSSLDHEQQLNNRKLIIENFSSIKISEDLKAIENG